MPVRFPRRSPDAALDGSTTSRRMRARARRAWRLLIPTDMHSVRLLGIAIAFVLGGCATDKSAVGTTTLTAATATPREWPERTGEGVHIDVTPPVDRVAPVELWRERYPQSALVLDAWAVRYPRAAERLAAWSVREPEKLEVLVFWSVTNPNDDAGRFLMERTSWSDLQELAHDEPEGLGAFLHWARCGPTAADELAVHHGGLAYVEGAQK
jgi:hypothetical protein